MAPIALAATPAFATLPPKIPASLVNPSPTPSQPTEDAAFLALPSVAWEVIGPLPERVHVGDRLAYLLGAVPPEVRAKTQAELKPAPPKGKTFFELGWELASRAPEPGYWLVPLQSGRLTLPSLPLVAEGSDQALARTEPLEIEVVSAISQGDPNPEQPVDLKGPVAVAFPWWVALVAALIMVLGVALAIFGLVKWSQKRGKPLPAIARPPRPEDEEALEALDLLERDSLWLKNQFKPHYFRLSEIFKRYLGARYGIDALELTSRELIVSLEEGKLAGDSQVDRVESVYERLDRVKFTDHVPSPAEAKELLDEVRKFVSLTRKPKAPPSLLPSEGGPRSGAGETHAP